jgi:AraC-like DNA-binding protein
MASRIKNVADASRQIVGETMALRLLVNYVSAIPSKVALASPRLQSAIVNHVYDLAALSICPELPADENNLQATVAGRLELATTYINKHFDSPGLTISAVARDQNISPRYLQRLIEQTGSTFSQRVQELRLQRAHMLLTDARHAQDRISDIALRAGFSDIAHFNRSFRRHFGDTPRNIRAGANPFVHT